MHVNDVELLNSSIKGLQFYLLLAILTNHQIMRMMIMFLLLIYEQSYRMLTQFIILLLRLLKMSQIEFITKAVTEIRTLIMLLMQEMLKRLGLLVLQQKVKRSDQLVLRFLLSPSAAFPSKQRNMLACGINLLLMEKIYC